MASRLRPVTQVVTCLQRQVFRANTLSSHSTRLPPILSQTQPTTLQSPSAQIRTLASASDLKVTPALPELDLRDKTILVTGAARGLGLCMAQALLEAGARVYALDRLSEDQRSPAFKEIETRAKNEWNTSLAYRQIDTRDVPALNKVVEEIANEAGSLDGLIAAAGIQQETPALDYTAEDANRMFEV